MVLGGERGQRDLSALHGHSRARSCTRPPRGSLPQPMDLCCSASVDGWLLLKSEKQRLVLVLSLLEPAASPRYQTWKHLMATAEKRFPFPHLKIFSESSC